MPKRRNRTALPALVAWVSVDETGAKLRISTLPRVTPTGHLEVANALRFHYPTAVRNLPETIL